MRNIDNPYRSIITVDRAAHPDEEEQHVRFFAFDRPMPNMTRYLVKYEDKPSRCGVLTEYARVKPVKDYLSYADRGEFWASYAPLPGMTMFNLRYTHSPYRCLVTTEARVGAIWRPHFALFAYEGVKLSVRVSPDGALSAHCLLCTQLTHSHSLLRRLLPPTPSGERYATTLAGLMTDWPVVFEFVAFVNEVPGSWRLNVLERHDPVHRFKITPGMDASRKGWKVLFSFFTFDVPVPGATKLSLQMTRVPSEQCRLSLNMPLPPWDHIMYVYAYLP